MKPQMIAVILVLALASLACSINIDLPDINIRSSARTGPTQTLTVNEALPQTQDAADITINMGAGKLNITGGSPDLMSGTIRYNIEDWRPTITRTGSELLIEQKHLENVTLSANITNDWELMLNDQVPLNLEINAGAYEGELNLSGLSLQNLDISDGASQTTVEFESLNPVEMSNFSYKTGASRVRLLGLAYANFETLTFESGAGDYTLDFAGELQRDALVSIKSGVSQVRVIVPQGMQVRVLNEGSLSNVDLDGSWTSRDGEYVLNGSGPLLTIEVDMGLGNLRLIQR